MLNWIWFSSCMLSFIQRIKRGREEQIDWKQPLTSLTSVLPTLPIEMNAPSTPSGWSGAAPLQRQIWSSFTGVSADKLHPQWLPRGCPPPAWLGWDISPPCSISCPCPRSRNRIAAQSLPASPQVTLASALHLRAGSKPRISSDLSVIPISPLCRWKKHLQKWDVQLTAGLHRFS